MSDKFKTEDDDDVKQALDEGKPMPPGTIYSPYNREATGSPLPEGMTGDEFAKQARGWDEPTKAKTAKETKATTAKADS